MPQPSPAKGAYITECGTYRYTLWRIWDSSKPMIMFIGLNPSTADAELDDPTIRRCIRFATDWEYGGFFMLNLFAFRATDPGDMKKANDPVGLVNNYCLIDIGSRCKDVVFVWGEHGSHRGRDKQVIAMFPNAWCMGKNKSGRPKHPLYLRSDTRLEPYRSSTPPRDEQKFNGSLG
ncbi:MAG: DUF1643 domain-containing protein [Cytophagaceae bacterium]|nr:MAG: DUF1643 domain-containing protein [Cytophagaceae bacterium]